MFRQEHAAVGVGVHAVRGPAAAGGAGGAEERGRHVLHELRAAAAVLRARRAGRAAHRAGLILPPSINHYELQLIAALFFETLNLHQLPVIKANSAVTR